MVAQEDNTVVIIEDVHSVFGASAKSNFNFGKNCGLIEGILACTDVSIERMQPKQWQRIVWEEDDIVMRGNKKDTKATSYNAARRIFRGLDFTKSPRATKPHDGMVDAALIAYAYGRQKTF